ncbi:UNVERIFIED_CONTAM: hypothetical protein Sradi_7310000 [Sesamum radiatum]|uniref:Reverse transcriptase domain-containing protein n=1 Tax=Sesamum radiatum TaxID=300843 RepID=A0AAW2I6G7_SESRA
MIVSILIHGLKKGPLASALARDPPEDVEQLMKIAQKYIDEEEINAMKDGECQRSRDRGRWKDNREKYVRTDKEKESPYQPKFHRYTPLATTRTKALMMVEKSNLLQWPQHTRFTPAKRFSNKYCRFHTEKGHDTEDCYQLKDEIERLVRQGYFKEFIVEQGSRSRDHKVGDRRTRSRSRSRERFKEEDRKDRGRENVPVKGVIHTIAGGMAGGWSNRERKRYERSRREDRRKELVLSVEPEEEITFGAKDLGERGGSQDDPMVISVILGRPGLNAFKAVVSTYHLKMKFSTTNGIGEVACDQKEASRCYNLSLQKGENEAKMKRKEREGTEGPELKRFKSERIEPVGSLRQLS